MEFIEEFQKIMDNLPDCKGVALGGMDGIVVESVCDDENIDFEILVAEYSSMVENTRQQSQSIELGEIKELSIIAEKYIIVMTPVTSEYFLIMIIGTGGNFGKGRYLLRHILPKIKNELL